MGHIRLARIPKRKQWKALFSAFEADKLDAPALAQAAAHGVLSQLSKVDANSTLGYSYWLIARLASAAHDGSLLKFLNQIGIQHRERLTPAEFVTAVGRHIEDRNREYGSNSFFDEFARKALRSVLVKHVQQRTGSLFEGGVDEISASLSELAGRTRFGIIGKEFFGHFLAQSSRMAVDSELAKYVGQQKPLNSTNEVLDLHNSLDSHCHEVATLVGEYSAAWLSLHNFGSDRQISESEATDFVKVAVEKLKKEFRGHVE